MTIARTLFVLLLAVLTGCRSGAPVPTGGTGGTGGSSAQVKYGAAPPDYKDLYILGASQGSVVFTDATGKEKVLAPGTSGNVLQSGGAGADPSWSSAGTSPTGSGFTHITSGVQDVSASKGTAAQIPITNAGATDVVWGSLSGDATIGATGVSTVAKVNGTTYPAGGALTTGNACYVSGVSACTYSAMNLAGGAGVLTGALPLGNQAAPTGTGLVKVSAGAWVAAGATLVDADVNAAASVAVSKLAAGSTGQILGPTPSWTSTPVISGLLGVDSIGGYTAQAFRFSTLSKSIAGGANVTLSTTEAQNRNITLTGAISADIFAIIPAGTALVAGSEYEITNSTTYTAITAAWMVNFKYASGGTGVWIPPVGPVRVVWTGSDFIYGEGSFAGGDITVTQSLITGVASTATALAKVPANFHLVQVYARQISTMIGGTTTISIGSSSGGQQLLTLGPTGPAGSIAGITTSGLGSDMASGDGYTHLYASGATFWIAQNQTVAPSTVGAIQLTFRGAVVP